MATRSVVAIPAGDGWMGRYVHWDGSPGSRLPVLLDLVKRDGLDAVIRTVIEDNYGWSYLDSTQTHELDGYHTDGRFIARPGYGAAYTLNQAGGSQMETDTTADPVWIEYVYIMGPRTITVLENTMDGWRRADSVRYDAVLEVV